MSEDTEEEIIMKPFTEKELEEGLDRLQKEKSPGSDCITKEILQHLGPSENDTTEDLQCQLEKCSSTPDMERRCHDSNPIEKTRPK